MKPLKKIIRKSMQFFIYGLLILLILAVILILLHEYDNICHIRTAYGDSFTLKSNYFSGDCYLYDDNSDFSISFSQLIPKTEIKAVCDTPYFRCYSVEDTFYFGKKKHIDDNKFFVIAPELVDYYLDYKF
ncbi:MAG: hypothetical protein IJ644_09500 [Oscillospiraceae bacterium]|nr:hypothetical protein [Oscillospiraceae bacterium]